MATIGSLVVDLKAETAAFRRDLGRARRDVRTFATQTNRSLGAINKGFGVLATGAKAFLGAFAAGAAARGINQTLESVAALADQADKVGLTTDALQELRFAAEQNSVAQNTLDMAMQRFTRRIGEAAQGGGELKSTLDQYGISATDAEGRTRDTRDVLGELADVMAAADSDAERLRIAFKAFDSEGAALVNVLRGGRAGLDELTASARQAGAVMDSELVERGREINRVWTRATTVLGTQAKSAVLELLVTLADAGENLRTFAATGELRVFRTETIPTIAALSGQLAELRADADSASTAMARLAEAGTGPRSGAGVAAMARDLEAATVKARAFQTALDSLSASQFGDPVPAVPVAPVQALSQEAAAQADRIANVTAELRFQAEQLGRTAEVQRVYTEAQRAGVEVSSAAGMEIRNLVERLQEGEREMAAAAAAADAEAAAVERLADAARQAASEVEQQNERMRSSVERSLTSVASDLLAGENAMDSLANAARSTVNAIISEFLRLAVIRPIVGAAFGALGIGTVSTSPAGGAPTGALFAHGGSFIADGPGGTDAIAQRINLTKGERVTVETAAQQRAGSGGGVTINQSFDFRGADQGVFARAQVFKQEIVRETVEVVQRLMDSGGPMAAASGRRR